MGPLSGQDPLLGPLSQLQGDDFDGPEPDPEVDEQRFQPRSDDEDTCVAPADTPNTPSFPCLCHQAAVNTPQFCIFRDFEDESHFDWMNEAEQIFLERRRL